MALVAVIAAAIALFFALGADRYFNLEYLSQERERFDAYYAANPFRTIFAYFLIYVLVTGLSLPGAAVLTLAGGALLGFWTGLVVVSFASTIGATLAFLASRFLFREWVEKRFGNALAPINGGIEREGGFYLFTLRLVPLFPFFMINLAMGLTRLRVWTFYWVSQVGMLAGTAVYVNAGTQLGQLESMSGILSPGLLFSFVLLGVFPLIAKRALEMVKSRRALARWDRPDKFDTNMVAIGAGAGGLVSSYIAAAVKAKVTLVERHRMGGDCLNTGCVPSKALIRSARMAHEFSRAEEFGIRGAAGEVDFAAVMDRVHAVIAKIEPHDSIERYTGLGVDCVTGEARITSPWTVEVDGKEIRTKSIVIASGAEPAVPPIPGLDEVGYLTSDTLWEIREQPKHLLVIGAGPIGCELAQAFARLGSKVSVLDLADRIMPREDADVSEWMTERLKGEGLEFYLSHTPQAFRVEGDQKILLAKHAGGEVEIAFDQVLVAVGRKARVENLGLEELGIAVTPRGTIEVNDFLQATYPNIFACGDVAGPYQFTHAAAHQAWYAAVNALFGKFWKFRVDYSVIPWTTYTDPEVARVGLNEQDASDQGIDFEVTRYELEELDRAITEGEDRGYVKVLTAKGKDRILGATIVGAEAGELITEFVTAMRHGLGLNKILGTIHAYPTLAEANKYVAGEWKRAHAPERILGLLGRFHRRQLGG